MENLFKKESYLQESIWHVHPETLEKVHYAKVEMDGNTLYFINGKEVLRDNDTHSERIEKLSQMMN